MNTQMCVLYGFATANSCNLKISLARTSLPDSSPCSQRPTTNQLQNIVHEPGPYNSSSTTPSADQPAFFPLARSTSAAAFLISQEGCLAMGGYCFPSRSTLGSQEQRSSALMESMTMGT